jgi:hypothetical protein
MIFNKHLKFYARMDKKLKQWQSILCSVICNYLAQVVMDCKFIDVFMHLLSDATDHYNKLWLKQLYDPLDFGWFVPTLIEWNA